MLENFLLVIGLSGQHKTVLDMLPASHVAVASRNQQNSVLLFRQVQNIQDSDFSGDFEVFFANLYLSFLRLLNRWNIYHQFFWIHFERLCQYCSIVDIHEVNFARAFFEKSHFIDTLDVLSLLDDPVNFYSGLNIRFDIALDLLWLAFEIFQYHGFFDDEVCKLLPLHAAIAIDINFIKELSYETDEAFITVREIRLPECKVFFCQKNELIQSQFTVLLVEFLAKETDGSFIKIYCHVRDHFLVIGLDLAVRGSGRVNRYDIQQVFAFSRQHEIRSKERMN